MNNKFNWRTFISFSLFFNLFLIFITGLVLYLKPTGQDAVWIHWRLLGLSKPDWEALHTITSYAFAIFAFSHLFFINWKVFCIYLSEKFKNRMKRSKELFASLVIVLILSAGTILEVPPFINVMNLGTKLSNSWVDKNDKIPFPGAERYSITDLISVQNRVTKQDIKTRFKKAQINYKSFDQSLAEVAGLNASSPLEIYRIMTR